MTYETEQELFCAGEFGSEYVQRNQVARLLASNLNFFSTALRRARPRRAASSSGRTSG